MEIEQQECAWRSFTRLTKTMITLTVVTLIILAWALL